MEKMCANGWCETSFEVTDDDLAFYEKVSPVIGGKKFLVPSPTLCPECRCQRRLAQVNRCHLFRGKSAFTGKEIISLYPMDRDLVIYENDIWWSDQWDPLEYGHDVETDKPLFPQLISLIKTTPHMALFNDQNENSPYVNTTGWAKNCHLCYGADYSQDCYYSEGIYYSRNSLDCLHGQNLERCYESTDCNDGYGLLFCQNCNNCTDSAFLYDCIGCKSCFGCVGLRHKEYCYFNEECGKEEYMRRMQQHFPLTQKEILALQTKLRSLETRVSRMSFVGTNNEAVSGDYLFNSKNAAHCFDSDGLQDCRYCSNIRKAKDCQDVNYWGHPGELCYESLAVGENASHILFSLFVWGGTENMLYCFECISCSNCFGCSGLRHKKYCIFNKQYSKEEYESRVCEIIETMQKNHEWGEFLPIPASLSAYNETLAQRFYPLTKSVTEERGWLWREVIDEIPKVTKIIPATQLPERIDAIPDDILQWAIQCEATKRPFRILKAELEFYRAFGLPIPHHHPDERLKERWLLRNPRKLWNRKCDNCGKGIETTYAPERPEIVYCEECYLKAVY
ncbi:MAG: Uncharacterized protein Greene041662_167 [Candidatus Peregrinibacteria bacterium Greene0416_62]|nr:MAG: Uncharacterized protein Greene041662_167 [Candidatus Peregrinibacteria bacterium Greene0416_62]TSD00752.1 MAG: Uncharacterized protein Greene101449_15 [Candidatus Peregrinibacteria bacterium Greene1014_49]